jgi:hypothetical protein
MPVRMAATALDPALLSLMLSIVTYVTLRWWRDTVGQSVLVRTYDPLRELTQQVYALCTYVSVTHVGGSASTRSRSPASPSSGLLPQQKVS